MINKDLSPVSRKMIQDLMLCKKNETSNISKQSKFDDLEFSLGYLYSNGLIETKKQLVEGIVRVYAFLTIEGSSLLENMDYTPCKELISE